MSPKVPQALAAKLTKALPALAVRGGGLGLQIAMTIVIARLLGAEGMGFYTLYATWLVLFADLVSIGMPVYALRTVASLQARSQGGLAGAFVWRVLLVVFLIGALVLLLPWLFATPMAALVADDASLAPALKIAAAGALLYAGMRILVEALKGAGATQRALFAESAIIPFAVIAVLPVLIVRERLSPETLLWLHVLAVGLALATALGFWLAIRPRSARGPAEAGAPRRGRLKPAHPSLPAHPAPPVITRALPSLWGGTLLNMAYVSLPILILPHFASVDELGEFGAAFRLINLVTVILVTLAAIFGPQFAAAFALGDAPGLRRLLRRSQQFSLILYGPVFIAFTAFAGPVLGLFGDEFRAAALLLAIMALGQLVNAATGLVGYLLNMMHQEHTEFLILLVTGILMTAGMIAGGLVAGVLGVTIAYSGGLMLKNILSLGFSLRALSILDAARPSPLPPRP
jgi:O-antigen/teichoic acid export membrane protein